MDLIIFTTYTASVLCLCLHHLNIFILCVADLQLDVKGCHDVYASFDKYVEVEHLDGDNKYHAEQYGLQVHGLTRFMPFIFNGI